MSAVTFEKPSLVSDDVLLPVLNVELSRTLGRSCNIVSLERRISEYYSSYLMEEIDVVLNDGQRIELIFKNLSRDGMLDGAVRNKPYFLYNPMREIESYRVVLSAHRIGTPRFYGAHVDPGSEHYWLFIERVPGTLLWQYGEEEIWQYVARWLGVVHRNLALEVDPGTPADPSYLKVFTVDYYWQWMDRAKAFLHRVGAGKGERSACTVDWLSDRFEPVVDRLMQLPVTLIHGEFYPSNVLVQILPKGIRVCAVDWETAAIGPGLIDLAALTSGSWTEEQRLGMAMSYYSAQHPDYEDSQELIRFLTDLDYCNLFMAVQWLGWSPKWDPPPEHAQNWLDEACRVAKKLGL